MTLEPQTTEDRRDRRRFGLLWFGAFMAAVLIVTAGAALVLRDGGALNDNRSRLDADGEGTAPVYDFPPVDVEPETSATSGASATRPAEVASRSLGGARSADEALQAPAAPAPAATSTPRPHGLHLILTSTLNAPLVPGAVRTLRVQVRNPNPFPVQLFRVDVRVLEPETAPDCHASWVKAGRYRYVTGPATKVAASGATYVNLPIQLVNLLDVDQNACQATAFPLRLSGMAVGN